MYGYCIKRQQMIDCYGIHRNNKTTRFGRSFQDTKRIGT
jgi:hypothetical protein